MLISSEWQDYKILKTGNGEKLEQWGSVTLLRPDPQIIWYSKENLGHYKGLHARYIRSDTGGGHWDKLKSMPDEWTISYKDLVFQVKPMGFKHTGLFPEQALNWDKMRALVENEKSKRKEQIKALNLFAYTGGASVALAKSGAFVTHVDAAKAMVERAKANCKLSKVSEKNTRWIVDDCKKFIERELRRGNYYDAILMDPPSYGRGANGEVWKLEENLYPLIELSVKLLSPNPLFFLLNSYTTGLGAAVMKNLLSLALKNFGGAVEAYELCLPTEEEGIILPCGNSAIWTQ